jgi:hypothetical protein
MWDNTGLISFAVEVLQGECQGVGTALPIHQEMKNYAQ